MDCENLESMSLDWIDLIDFDALSEEDIDLIDLEDFVALSEEDIDWDLFSDDISLSPSNNSEQKSLDSDYYEIMDHDGGDLSDSDEGSESEVVMESSVDEMDDDLFAELLSELSYDEISVICDQLLSESSHEDGQDLSV